MTTNGNNPTSSPEGESTSLESLAVDSSQLGLAELKERQLTRELSLSSGLQHEEAIASEQLSTDLSALSSHSGASIRTEMRQDLTSTSSAARRAALHARLDRLRERPTFVEKVRSSSARNRASQDKPLGIFNNPYYKYRGGIFARVITLLANILKLLEALLLRRLSPLRIEQKKTKQEPVMPLGSNPTELALQKKKEEEKLREQKKMRLPGARMGGR